MRSGLSTQGQLGSARVFTSRAMVPLGEGGGWRVGVEAGRVWAGVGGRERRAGGAVGGVPR
ncbi:hypothetical protein E2C01_016458 [Portunus trituberculatus]|uniref:Uncharacterized protein n=1 Tax=Portunus trituberculatus TaxID=210409 RepID=A0A5B7DQY8_PORTR|nr:hypothetical protein [Portunus trituberculatus]